MITAEIIDKGALLYLEQLQVTRWSCKFILVHAVLLHLSSVYAIRFLQSDICNVEMAR